jgi:uncharacterized protein (TIGR02996 family)
VSAESERKAFLKALKKNEDDTTTRLVYADWLDDRGEHEEADRQRKWPAAKEWLVKFCGEHNPPEPDIDPEELEELIESDPDALLDYGYSVSYEELIELGKEAIKNGDREGYWLSCGNNMDLCDALRDNCAEFWKNWCIVTGTPLPPDIEEKSVFSCAC